MFSASLLGGLSEVDVLVDVHTLTAHHQEMAKHSEVLGFTSSHIPVVQLLDRTSGQAITQADASADVIGPDQKALAKGMTLKWFAPQGRSPYYGMGLELTPRARIPSPSTSRRFRRPGKRPSAMPSVERT